MFRNFISLVAGLLLAAAPAVAATTTNINFNDGSAPGFSGPAGSFAIFTGSNSIAAAPYVNELDTTPYLAVPGFENDNEHGNALTSGEAILSLGGKLVSFAFDWGSIDNYNTLSFLNGNGDTLFTFVGSGIGDRTAAGSTRWSQTFDAADGITQVKFASAQRAFEIDNITFGTVPEPEMWAMLLIGFGMVGVSTRRRNTAVTA